MKRGARTEKVKKEEERNKMRMEKVSIITVSLNAIAYIEDTIKNVQVQSYPHIEHVIIDGGSTDGTVDVINKYRDRIGYFISEPDNGIYSAMNKGINVATGDILFFLNADDRFCDDEVVEDVVSVFEQKPDLDIVYGNLIWDLSGKMAKRKQPAIITREFLARRTVLHQTVFARRDVFKATNGFSECYKVVSDYEWMVRVFLRDGRKYLYCDRDIAVMGTEGQSWTNSDWEKERIDVMKKHFGFHEIMKYRILPMTHKSIWSRMVLSWHALWRVGLKQDVRSGKSQ